MADRGGKEAADGLIANSPERLQHEPADELDPLGDFSSESLAAEAPLRPPTTQKPDPSRVTAVFFPPAPVARPSANPLVAADSRNAPAPSATPARPAPDAHVDAEGRVSRLDAHKQALERALADAARLADVVSGLEARLATLTAPNRGLAHAEMTVGDLERRTAAAVTAIEQCANQLDAQRQTIERTRGDAARVIDLVSTLDARARTLIAPDHPLAEAERIVGDLERRAAATAADLEREVDAHNAQSQRITAALGEAERVRDVALAVDARAASLTAPDSALADAEAALADLERRAAATVGDIQLRFSALDMQKQTLETALAEAERVRDVASAVDARVAVLTAPHSALAQAQAIVRDLEGRMTARVTDVERCATQLNAQAQVVERTLAETARVNDVVSSMGARVAVLTRNVRALVDAEATAGDVAQQVASVQTDIERSANRLDAQAQMAERALADATRISEIVAAVDARLTALMRSERLADAAASVEDLERRTAEAVGRLERAAQEKAEVESAPAGAEGRLAHIERRPARASVSDRGWFSVPVVSRNGQKGNRLVRRAAVGLGAVAILMLLAIFVLRAPGGPPAGVPAQSDAGRARGPASQPPTEPQHVERSQPAPLTAAGPQSTEPSHAVSRGTAGTPSAQAPPQVATSGLAGRTPAGRPVRPAPTRATPRPSTRPSSTRNQRAAARSSQTPSERNSAEQFVGILGVQSEPSGAAVFVDQRRVGETPLELTQLRAGSHAVRIAHDGYRFWTGSVLVPAGKRTQINTVLQPITPSPVP